jgi:hypothetical protein
LRFDGSERQPLRGPTGFVAGSPRRDPETRCVAGVARAMHEAAPEPGPGDGRQVSSGAGHKGEVTMKTLLVSLMLALPALAAAADKNQPGLLLPIGMSADIGGGFQTFLDSDATDFTKPGGTWTARFVFGTRSYLAGEAAYIGSAQAIDSIGIENHAMLLSNGLEGLVRMNASTGAWQPYAVAGVAWRRYSLQNTNVNTSSMLDSDDVAEIPVGLGLAYRTRGLIVDLRATYNNSFGQRLIPNASLSTLGATLKLGFEF